MPNETHRAPLRYNISDFFSSLLGSSAVLLVCQLGFHQSVYGTSDSKLKSRPFKQDPADIAECSAFPLGDRFEFTAQVLADSEADLYFPLAHQSHLDQLADERA